MPSSVRVLPPTRKKMTECGDGRKRRCVCADSNVGINFIISSATAYLSRGFSNISRLNGEGLACLLKPHFIASLNPWPSMIAFKAVKPQIPCLSFIIYVCGLRKKLLQGKSFHRGIQIASVWHWLYLPSMGMLFSLICFQLLLLCLFIYCSLFWGGGILLFPFLASLLGSLSLLCLSLRLSLAISRTVGSRPSRPHFLYN